MRRTEWSIEDWKNFENIWKGGGSLPDGKRGERFPIQDALATTNAGMFFPKVIDRIVKEAVEPILVGARLLTPIRYSYGQTITFPAMGALEAADIGEGQEYPEVSLDAGGSTVTASTGKSGIAIKFTEEMIRYSQYDVMSMCLRQAGYALGRHKEKKIFNFIRALGSVVFDNLQPTLSMNGPTHGRNLQGQPNGSLTVDDIFDTWGQIVSQGYTPNTMLMHPLTWVMFCKDPVLRAFALQNGGGVFMATWNGNPAGRAPWDNSSQGNMGVSGGQNIVPGQTGSGQAAAHGLTPSPVLSYPQTLTSSPQLPSYMNIPLLIIVSPFVPFNAARKLTDIYMFDRNNLGALIVDEEVTSGEWTDPSTDITKIKLKERYGVAIFAEGQAIGIMRNVFIRPNEIVLPAQSTISVSGAITAIDPSTPILI